MSTQRNRLKNWLQNSLWVILLAYIGTMIGLIVDVPQLAARLGGISPMWRKLIFAVIGAILWFSVLFVVIRVLTRLKSAHRCWLLDLFGRPGNRDKIQGRVAFAALIIIPLLFLINPIYRAIPPRRTIVLVANFVGPEGRDEYGVTDHILKQLGEELADEPTMEIRHLDEFITVGQGSEYTRRVGNDNKATIVIWGRYMVTAEAVKVWAEFEMLREATDRIPIGTTEQTTSVAQLNSFQIQTELAERMTAFVAFVKALLLYDQARNFEAHEFFTLALQQWPEDVGDITNLALESYMGANLLMLGRANQALSHLQDAETLLQFIGGLRMEEAIFGNLGLAYYQLGHMEQAIDYYEQTLAITQETDNQQGESNALNGLGNICTTLGQMELGIEYYQRALAIAKKIGDQRMESTALSNMGVAYADAGQVELAIKYHQQALAITRKIGNRRAQSYILGNLGNVYFQVGQTRKAIKYCQKALTISREVGDRWSEAADLNNLGVIFADMGQMEQAIERFQQALAIAQEIGDRRGEGNALGNLGLAYRHLGQVERAIEFTRRALTIFEEIKSPYAEQARQQLAQLEEAMREGSQ